MTTTFPFRSFNSNGLPLRYSAENAGASADSKLLLSSRTDRQGKDNDEQKYSSHSLMLIIPNINKEPNVGEFEGG